MFDEHLASNIKSDGANDVEQACCGLTAALGEREIITTTEFM